MKLLKPKQGFLGIDGKNNLKTKSIIIPFGLEKTVTYGKGTRNGPKEIIKASHQVELFDEDLNCEPCKKFGFKTIKFFKIKNDMKSSLQQIEKIVKKVIENKQFPIDAAIKPAFLPIKLMTLVAKIAPTAIPTTDIDIGRVDSDFKGLI